MKCFAERIKGKCVALNVKCCVGYGNCNFYKSEEQHKADQQQTADRIAKLPTIERMAIKSRYYNKKEW